MKASNIIKATILGTLVLAGCSQGQSSTSTTANSVNDAYTCISKNLWTGRTYTHGGKTQAAAAAKADADCRVKNGDEGCVRVRCFDNTLLGSDLTGPMTCQVEDIKTGRVWYRNGATRAAAAANALDYCQSEKAGIECQVRTCFDQVDTSL